MINPPGRARRTADNRILYQIRTNHYFSSCVEFERIRNSGKPCPIYDESYEVVGNISRISPEDYRAVILKHPYLLPARSLDDALSLRQPAAPLFEAEPGQTVLGVC